MVRANELRVEKERHERETEHRETVREACGEKPGLTQKKKREIQGQSER